MTPLGLYRVWTRLEYLTRAGVVVIHEGAVVPNLGHAEAVAAVEAWAAAQQGKGLSVRRGADWAAASGPLTRGEAWVEPQDRPEPAAGEP